MMDKGTVVARFAYENKNLGDTVAQRVSTLCRFYNSSFDNQGIHLLIDVDLYCHNDCSHKNGQSLLLDLIAIDANDT